MKNSDATWIEAVLAGDVDVYGSLVKRYHKSVYAAAWSVVRDSTVAEDIAQEAFITSFARLSQLRDPSAFAAWLRRITVNAARMWLRTQPASQVVINMDTFADTKTGGECSLHEGITVALNSLPRTKREVAVLCYMDGVSRKDAANFLGVSPSTLRKRLHDAKKLLQRRIVESAVQSMEEHLLPRDFERRCICACQRALETAKKEVIPVSSKKSTCGCGCLPLPKKKKGTTKKAGAIPGPKKGRPTE